MRDLNVVFLISKTRCLKYLFDEIEIEIHLQEMFGKKNHEI